MQDNTTIAPPVSIALCTYNGALFISQQLDSILNQTYKNITEIICVDDKSTDTTIYILSKYKEKDSRIKIFQNEYNLGYVKNFEKALSLCNEAFIALSDQDDIWHPNKIEWQIEAIEDNLIIYSDSEYIDENNQTLNRKLSDYRHLGSCTSCLNLALFNGISGHTMLIKQDLIAMATPFPIEIPHDHWLSFVAAKNKKITFIDRCLVQYRQHSQSAIGGFGSKRRNKKNPYTNIHTRLTIFGTLLKPDTREKQCIDSLADTYIDLSIRMRIKKVKLFLRNKQELLFFKKRSNFRKTAYCICLFWRIL